MGEGAFIRIQNKSEFDVTVEFENLRNVAEGGMDKMQGAIAAGAQLPEEGETKFDGGQYQYIEGENRFFFQKDGYFGVVANVEGSSPSSLYLKVDNDEWWSEDKSPDADSKVNVVADVTEVEGVFKIEIRIYNNYHGNKWMAELAKDIRDTPLCRVGLPGTHDSGTYQFDKDMGASPDNDLTSTIQEKLGILGGVKDMILGNIFERLCQCQDMSIKDQLNMGVRYLDLRIVYHKESGKYYTCHGVYCADMKDIIDDINKFLSANPKEIVILDFNHLYDMEGQHNEFVNAMLATLGDKVADRQQVKPNSKVSEFWKNGFQAVVLYCDKPTIKDYPGKLWGPGNIQSPWPNVIETKELHEKLKGKVKERDPNTFFVLQGILTPDVELIKKEILESGGASIKSIAVRCSPKVVDWVDEDWKQEPMNVVIVDFVQNCSMVPAIINYNRK